MSLLLDDTDLDLAMREADVAIRMHPPKQPDLVQRHLMDIHWHVCRLAGIPQKARHAADAPRIWTTTG